MKFLCYLVTERASWAEAQPHRGPVWDWSGALSRGAAVIEENVYLIRTVEEFFDPIVAIFLSLLKGVCVCGRPFFSLSERASWAEAQTINFILVFGKRNLLGWGNWIMSRMRIVGCWPFCPWTELSRNFLGSITTFFHISWKVYVCGRPFFSLSERVSWAEAQPTTSVVVEIKEKNIAFWIRTNNVVSNKTLKMNVKVTTPVTRMKLHPPGDSVLGIT